MLFMILMPRYGHTTAVKDLRPLGPQVSWLQSRCYGCLQCTLDFPGGEPAAPCAEFQGCFSVVVLHLAASHPWSCFRRGGLPSLQTLPLPVDCHYLSLCAGLMLASGLCCSSLPAKARPRESALRGDTFSASPLSLPVPSAMRP